MAQEVPRETGPAQPAQAGWRRDGDYLVMAAGREVELPRCCVYCGIGERLSVDRRVISHHSAPFDHPTLVLVYYRCGRHWLWPRVAGNMIYLMPVIAAALVHYDTMHPIFAVIVSIGGFWAVLSFLSYCFQRTFRIADYKDGHIRVTGFAPAFLEAVAPTGAAPEARATPAPPPPAN
jgi:hypothetical protein